MNKVLSCHCKKVRIQINLPVSPKLVRCNCSICKRKGAIMTMIEPDGFKILAGADFIKKYKFHTKAASHFFCSNCGIYTHHNPRRNPSLYGVNVGCLEDFNFTDNQEIKIIDGKNHPMDEK